MSAWGFIHVSTRRCLGFHSTDFGFERFNPLAQRRDLDNLPADHALDDFLSLHAITASLRGVPPESVTVM